MSAFVHENDHIDLIVTAAVQVEARRTMKDPTARFGFSSVELADDADAPGLITPTGLGRILLVENVRSMRHLYPSLDETPEGVEYDMQISGYSHTPVDLVAEFGDEWAAPVLHAIASLEYQSCEHPDWEESEAAKWLEAIRARVIGHLPGYGHANSWVFCRTDQHATA